MNKFLKESNLIKLKIKSKHLALEPGIIRKEEQKALRGMSHNKYFNGDDITNKYENRYIDLHYHRKQVVAVEARATYLAIAFIKGKRYKAVESKTHNLSLDVINRIVTMVAKYDYITHGRDQKEIRSKIEQWIAS